MLKRSHKFMRMIIKGFFHGIGFSLSVGLFAFIILLFMGKISIPFNPIVKIQQQLGIDTTGGNQVDLSNYQSSKKIENPLIKYITSDLQIKIPDNVTSIYVSNSKELIIAIRAANTTGNVAIILSSGLYTLNKTISIKNNNIMFLSELGSARDVIIEGRGMIKTHKPESLFEVSSSGFVLDGITLQKSPNHLIQIKSEHNAHFPIIRNCILRDAYEQIIKVSYDKKNRPNNYSENGLIENCEFSYSEGIGPNYYIGGIDAHGIRNWTIRNNLFKDIASPSKHIAEHAIHLWNNSENNLVENNIIIDSDRGIGFGLWKKTRQNENKHIRFSNFSGVIKGNIIYHGDNQDKFADTGIIIENSPKTIIENNIVFIEHDYPRGIEYRFPQTKETLIKYNKTNKAISSRNGGSAKEELNDENLSKIDFIILLNKRLKEFNSLPHLYQ